MKERPVDGYAALPEDRPRKKKPPKGEPLVDPWWETLSPRKIVNHLPIMTHAKGARHRIQLPIHDSTEVIATMLRERHPEKFRTELDVYKSMLYAGRQLFEYVFLQNCEEAKKSKIHKFADYIYEFERITHWENWLEFHLKNLYDAFINCDQKHFKSNDFEANFELILAQITEIKNLIPEKLHSRLDVFIEEDLHNEVIQSRVKEKLRKREYRERIKNLQLVKK